MSIRSLRRPVAPLLMCLVVLLVSGGCAGGGLLGSKKGAAPPTAEKSEKSEKKNEKSKKSGGKTDGIAEARNRSMSEPLEPYWPYRLGELYVASDSLARAEGALGKALERDPLYGPALSLLSKLYFERGRYEEAVGLLERARTQPAHYPGGVPDELLAGLALHYDALDRPDLAQQVVSGIRRGEEETRPSLVYLTLRGPAPDAAKDLAEAALKNDPKSAVNQNNYGITRLRAGDPKAAREAFEAAMKLDPALPGPYYNLAIVEKYYLLDDKAAARWFRMYRDRARDDPDGLGEALLGESPVTKSSEERE